MRPLLATLLVLAGVLLQPGLGSAQITLDGTIRPGAPSGPLPGPNFVIPSDAGATKGNNLFHSFGQFNLQTGQSATFTGPTSTENVISRVTGGTRSFIDGLIDSKTFMPSANFFFLNPSGVLFGANARLSIGGSFHTTTADCVRAIGASCSGPDDGTKLKFFADPTRQSVLTADAPAAFGFLNPNPVRIVVQGSTLQVDAGKTLSLVGGQAAFAGEADTGLTIAGTGPASPTSTLSAPGGRIQIVSVASAGDVVLSPNLDVSAIPTLGRIDLSNGARLDASGDPGGTVIIRGGRLSMDQGSMIVANTTGVANGAATAVDLQVSGDVVIGGGAGINVQTSGSGAAGDVEITASRLEMNDSTFIQSITNRGGVGGDITVDVGTLVLTAGASISASSQQPLFGGGGGPGGNLIVTATDAVTIDGASSGLSTFTTSELPGGTGTGGGLSLSAPSLALDHNASLTSLSFGPAAGGDIAVVVGSLSLSNGGSLVSRTTFGAPGGKVDVTATDSMSMSGSGSGIFSGSAGTGSTGAIKLNAGRLLLASGAEIRSGTILDPAGGNVTVDATESIVISGRDSQNRASGISSQAFSQDVGQVSVSAPSVLINDGFIATSTIGSGKAGPVFVDAGTLTLTDGGQIVSSSALAASGAGGAVTITATDAASISGRAPGGLAAAPFAEDPSSGVFSTASGTGTAGQIAVATPSLILAEGAKISVSTSGTGPAGDIKITAGQIQLLDGATISANSTGPKEALAGNINIFTDDLTMKGGSSITTQSTLADGGNITITTAGSQLYLLDSQITTSVQSGVGSGGNITLGSGTHPVEFIILNGSQVRADAFGGPGGNISIFADTFLTSESVLSASSALSTPGAINVQAKFTNLSGNLAQLPETVLQAASLLRAACAARLAEGKTSSLVVAGREGLPLEPGGLMPSPLIAESPTEAGPARSDGRELDPAPGAWRVALRSKCSM
jgi:filamentous hemagglutinin family protein